MSGLHWGSRRLARVLIALLLAVIPAGVGAPPASAAPPSTLRIALTQDIDSLNPFLAIFASSNDLMRSMYEFLTLPDAKTQQPTPGLADHWTSAPDQLTWTFHLRDARWSDGTPITARDAAFTFNLMLNNPSAGTANGNFVAEFDRVTATDDHTLVIHTKVPQSTMLALDVPIVPEHVWSQVKDVATFGNDTMPVVGSGPFVLTDYKQGQYVTLKANPTYWRGRPAVDELQFVTYQNTDAAVQALRKGEVDLVRDLTPAQFDALHDAPGVTQNNARGRRFTELLANPGAAANTGQPIGDGNPALHDPRVRTAIFRALDDKTLVDKVLGGYGAPGSGYIPPVFTSYALPPDPDPLGYDPAAANQLLDAAGYRRGTDGMRTTPDGKPLRLRLIGHNQKAPEVTAGQYLKEWLHTVGIDVEVQMVSSNQLNDATQTAKYDLAFSGWAANPDPDYILSIQTCASRPGPDGKGGTPDSFLCDPRYDELYQAQQREFDPARRSDLVRQAQRELAAQSVLKILYNQNALEAYRSDRFAPFQVQPDPGGVITQQNGYWGYYLAKPVAARGSATSGTGMTIGVAAAVVVLAGGAGVLLARRRRATANERE